MMFPVTRYIVDKRGLRYSRRPPLIRIWGLAIGVFVNDIEAFERSILNKLELFPILFWILNPRAIVEYILIK